MRAVRGGAACGADSWRPRRPACATPARCCSRAAAAVGDDVRDPVGPLPRRRDAALFGVDNFIDWMRAHRGGRRADGLAEAERRDPGRRPSRPASSSWATWTRPATAPDAAARRRWAATAPTWSSASCTRGWRPSASTCATGPPARPTRSCWPPSSSGAGPAARRWPWPPSATTPSWAPTRRATTPSCTATTRAACKCPLGAHARRMNPRDSVVTGEVRLHRMIRRGTSYGPTLPARRAGGRRRRPRDHVRLHRGAPGAAVRVRQDAVGQRRQVLRRARRAGPAGRAERRRRPVHCPAAADPSAAARSCPASWSTAAASTASSPACAPCAGSPSSTVRRRWPMDDDL